MAKNEMIRSALFGGYNKSDVDEYIQTLENEIDAVKALHQKEKNDLAQKMESDKERQQENEEQILKLREELDQKEKLLKEKEHLQERNQEMDNAKEELEHEKAELKSKKEMLDEQSVKLLQDAKELKEKEAQIEEEKKKIKELEKQLRDAKTVQHSGTAEEPQISGNFRTMLELNKEHLQVENDILRAELKKAKMKAEETEEKLRKLQEQGEKDILDSKTLAMILQEANKNAEMIKEEAREEGDKIVAAAKAKAKEQQCEVTKWIDAELEKKNIQMLALKYRIAEYMKEVRNTQEGLYNLYDKMNNMVENMPLRLENYYNGEEYHELEMNEEVQENSGQDERSSGFN